MSLLPLATTCISDLLEKEGTSLLFKVQLRNFPLKVIYPKYSKHLSYTLAHTIDCLCSKMLNYGLNHGLFLSLFKFFG